MTKLSIETIKRLEVGTLLYCVEGNVIGLVSEVIEEVFYDLRFYGFQLLGMDGKDDFIWESCLAHRDNIFF
mgnify:CR=1 FL=1